MVHVAHLPPDVSLDGFCLCPVSTFAHPRASRAAVRCTVRTAKTTWRAVHHQVSRCGFVKQCWLAGHVGITEAGAQAGDN